MPFIVLFGLSCQKEELTKSYSSVYVSAGGEESFPMDDVEGDWDIRTNVGHISGEGSAYERIQLYLPDIRDTGNYPYPSIKNIFYSDGSDFSANGFVDGTIHISRRDRNGVVGAFKATLSDSQNGTETRRCAGTFRIIAQ